MGEYSGHRYRMAGDFRMKGKKFMYAINRNEIERLRKEYPAGTRVRLIFMDDAQSPPPGTEGIVSYIDDAGTIHVGWANGSGLGVILPQDRIEKV